MRNYEVKKIWNGRVSLRSYVVDSQIKKNEPIKVTFKNDTMILSVRELMKKDSMTECTSKFDGTKYKLYDYVWRPIDKRQKELLWTTPYIQLKIFIRDFL